MEWRAEHYELISKAAEKHGFGLEGCDVECVGTFGGNCFGEIRSVKVTSKEGGEVFHWVLKSAPIDGELRRKRAILPAFQRELEIYTSVLPSLLQFQDVHRLETPFTGSARFYAGTSEAILLDDLTYQGYELWKPSEPMGMTQMYLVVQEYAKFHSISLALRLKNPEQFDRLTKNIQNNFLEEREATNPQHYKHLMEVVLDMGHRAVQGHEKARRGHGRFKVILPRFWQNNKARPERDLLVVSHGDCHPNNIFLHPDSSVRVIDWQLSCVESPMHDLSFALYACASKDVLSRSKDLLELYQRTVARNLRQLGVENATKVFSLDVVEEHWRRHFLHGLYRAQMTLKLTLEDATDDGSKSVLDRLKQPFGRDSKFAKRIRDIFETVQFEDAV